MCRIIIYGFLILLNVLQILSQREIGKSCANENDSDGRCTLVTNCEPAMREIDSHRTHRFTRCGFKGADEIVCCPIETTINKNGHFEGNRFANKDDTKRKSIRIADKECANIIKITLLPLTTHIIGGEEAANGEFPHMAALGYDKGNGYEFLCGGSLVSKHYIITAAHCIETLDDVKPTIARLGVLNITSTTFNTETDVKIADWLFPSNYTRKYKYHDIAILRLKTPVTFTQDVSPICLYTKNTEPTTPLTVTGWGRISKINNKVSDVLLKANVSMMPHSKCSETYVKSRRLPQGIVQDQQLCVGDSQQQHDTCTGDSGGPLQGMTDHDGFYRLVGVTSFGRGCASKDPAIYTRIYHYLDWIVSVVWPQSTE
ncbi:unnamed protein product [Leptidea sinapis]|uniref:Peptidase S1 domain-containing protein n=1 Tax=Leptidea sinapis TaxID=189913 RepID=A0A5E4Q3P8_9NEOP|nr:unnamed protein product [Leptidea sinapis]